MFSLWRGGGYRCCGGWISTTSIATIICIYSPAHQANNFAHAQKYAARTKYPICISVISQRSTIDLHVGFSFFATLVSCNYFAFCYNIYSPSLGNRAIIVDIYNISVLQIVLSVTLNTESTFQRPQGILLLIALDIQVPKIWKKNLGRLRGSFFLAGTALSR